MDSAKNTNDLLPEGEFAPAPRCAQIMVRFCKAWLITWVFGAAICLSSGEAMAASMRSIPDDNLGYPVLITGKSNQGSGFFFNTDTATYLVTAKHVLFDPATQHLRDSEVQLVSYPKDPSDTTRNVFGLDLAALEKAGNIRSHPTEDVAVVKIGTTNSLPPPSPTPAAGAPLPALRMMTMLPGVTEIEISQSGIVGVGPETVKTYSQVLTGTSSFSDIQTPLGCNNSHSSTLSARYFERA